MIHRCFFRQITQLITSQFDRLIPDVQLYFIIVTDVDRAIRRYVATIPELLDFRHPDAGGQSRVDRERTPAQRQGIPGIVLRLDHDAVRVVRERFHQDVTQHLTAVDGVVLGVLLLGEGGSVHDRPARQDRGHLHVESVHQVRYPDAQIFIFDATLFVLLVPVSHIPSLQFDGQGDGGLFVLPAVVRDWDVGVGLAGQTRVGVAAAFEFHGFLETLVAEGGWFAAAPLGLEPAASDAVADAPVAQVFLPTLISQSSFWLLIKQFSFIHQYILH